MPPRPQVPNPVILELLLDRRRERSRGLRTRRGADGAQRSQDYQPCKSLHTHRPKAADEQYEAEHWSANKRLWYRLATSFAGTVYPLVRNEASHMERGWGGGQQLKSPQQPH